jgi:hypothetical protein
MDICNKINKVFDGGVESLEECSVDSSISNLIVEERENQLEDPKIVHRSSGSEIQADLSSSLVISVHKLPFKSNWIKSQRRIYHRVLSGFECAKRVGDHVRVITLTSAEGSGDIHHSFGILKKRIRRKYGRFEYCCVKELTKQGFHHLHIVYRGSFIEQEWLSDAWKDIHGAPIVWIAKLYSWFFAKHLARYFVKEAIGRFWMSWGWVYRGFVKDWKIIVHKYGKFAVNYWNRLLHGDFIKIYDRFELKAPWVSQKAFKVN